MSQLGTALVTGASSGIGEAYARRLAHDGYNLIITARREDRLNVLAAELKNLHSIDVQVIATDLSTVEGVEVVAQAINNTKDLTILVNNAGIAPVGYFDGIAWETQHTLLNLHIQATTRLTYAAVPQMRQQQRGTIINVSSVTAFLGMPGSVTYNASKAFINSFSDGLAAEVAPDGIRVQAICPGFTTTKMAERYHGIIPVFAWMSPDDVVSESLSQLRKPIAIPGNWNRLAWLMLKFPLSAHIAKRMTRQINLKEG